MEITRIADHPEYDDTRIMVSHILRLGNAIKRDISRIISLGVHDSSNKTEGLIRNGKMRILKRLEQISNIRYTKKNTQKNGSTIQEDGSYVIQDEEQWNQILHGALTQVYKHSDTPEFRTAFHSLMSIDQSDISKTGIHFLRAYMRMVARIPEDQIISPFKP